MGEKVDQYELITERLREYYTEDEISQWWNLPHPQLDGLPAITVCMDDDGPDRINAVIDRLDAGGYL